MFIKLISAIGNKIIEKDQNIDNYISVLECIWHSCVYSSFNFIQQIILLKRGKGQAVNLSLQSDTKTGISLYSEEEQMVI